MPVDKNGVRADCIMDGNATVNRSNYGRLIEHYTNSASRDILIRLRNNFGIIPTDKYTQPKVELVYQTNRQLFEQSWQYLMDYYEIIQPVIHYHISKENDEVKINHLSYILDRQWEAIHLYLPTDNPVDYSRACEEIEKKFKPLWDKVTYVYNGRLVTSEENVRIASMHVLLLEKTGDDWSATASGKLQHFGILSQITRSDKFSTPIRGQAIRALGEAENRGVSSYTIPEASAELMDRNNNPNTHREIVRNIILADKPTNIDCLVDRQKIPFGGAKPLQILKHAGMCAGWKFVYKDDPNFK